MFEICSNIIKKVKVCTHPIQYKIEGDEIIKNTPLDRMIFYSLQMSFN